MKTLPAVVVLGAGRDARFAGPRPRLAEPLGQETVLAHTLRHAIGSGLSVVLVTTAGFVGDATKLLASRDVVVIDTSRCGMGDSIAAGVAARSGAAGWLMLPADMPMVRPQTLRLVADGLGQHAVVVAQYRGMRGHPVACGVELFSELVHLRGNAGTRRLVARYPAMAIDVDDPGVLQTMDSEDGARNLRQMWAQQAGVDSS